MKKTNIHYYFGWEYLWVKLKTNTALQIKTVIPCEGRGSHIKYKTTEKFSSSF